MQPLLYQKKSISFVLGFGLVFLFLCYCLCFYHVRYESNDEIGNIDMIIGGVDNLTELNSPYLSKILSCILAICYRTLPDFPWYGMVLYLAIFLGISLILSLIIRNTSDPSFVYFPSRFFAACVSLFLLCQFYRCSAGAAVRCFFIFD